MAFASYKLLEAVKNTARKLSEGAPYAWGHHGQCNCGNLAQELCTLSAGDIMRYAHTGIGEWTELAQDFCPQSKAPADLLVQKLLEAGLSPTDIHHLEYLSDREVLKHLDGGFRWLKRNVREDAIAYFEAMASMLEEQLLERDIAHNLKVAHVEHAHINADSLLSR